MSNIPSDAGTRQERWARFRFSVIGPLLSAPPEPGQLQTELAALAQKQWRHPITGLPVHFGYSTIERWLYQARPQNDPVGALRTKRRQDAGTPSALSAELKVLIQHQYRSHPGWSYQLHFDNLKTTLKSMPESGEMPSYNTLRRYMKANGFCKQRDWCISYDTSMRNFRRIQYVIYALSDY